MIEQFNGIGTRVDLTPGLQQVLKVYAATNGRCTNCLSPVTLEKAHFIAAATCQILCPLCSMLMRVFCAFPETGVDAMEHLVNKAVFEVTGRVPRQKKV
ncbi:MAG: hypothetical protein ABSF37_06150 [Sedimentisphaerales bacterium]|jgi:hypothetical protein